MTYTTLKKLKKQKGFTLIELLVVIAIIGTLAAISTPIIRSVIEKGKIEETKMRMNELTAAMDSYNNDQGRLPHAGDDHPSDDTEYDEHNEADQIKIIKVLMNLDEDYSSGTNYLKMPTAKSGRNGIVYNNDEPSGFRDSWGKAYFMKVDYNLDGKISQAKGSDNLESDTESKTYILISSGINGKFGGAEEDDIGSW